MTSELSEWRIVRRLAEQVCQRVTRRVIRALREIVDGLQSGDDSSLANVWEEICVQVQGEQSVLWGAYDVTVRQIVSTEVTALPEHERDAVWLQTPEGEEWDAEEEDERTKSPVTGDNIIDYLTNDYVYSAAANWSNPRIRKYLELSSRTD